MKRTKGITLIALVITIIVLLILAGVSLATLTGENGILNKANRASNKTNESSMKEQIEIAILSSRSNETNQIDLMELEKEILKIQGIKEENIEKQGEEGKLPWLITTDELQYQITEDGIVEVIRGGIVLSSTQIKLPIGGTAKVTARIIGNKKGTIQWSCSDTSEGIIDFKEGEIIAKGAGECTITASVELEGEVYTKECKIHVLSNEEWIAQRIETIVRESRDENSRRN